MNQELRITNKKFRIKSIIRNSLFVIRKSNGFTLIELIVVISVAAVISVIGIAAFASYNQTQSLNTAAADIANMFSVAKSRTASQVKPSSCVGSLDGYEIRLCVSSGSTCINLNSANYELDVKCNGSVVYPPILTGKLPSNITFDSIQTTPLTHMYSVLTGGFSGAGTIALSGFGQTKIINVYSSGYVK